MFSSYRRQYVKLAHKMTCSLLSTTARRLSAPGRFLTSCLGLVGALGILAVPASAVVVGQLRCEYLKDPLGIDVPQPRLSWVLRVDKRAPRGQCQSGYQVLVASNQRELEANQGDLWDSGRMASDQSIQVRYAGKELASEQECYWEVRVWDEQGKPSAWSEPARWTMGLLKPSDWHAEWIGLDEPAASRDAKKVLGDAQWIWFPEGQPEKAAPIGTRYFRRVFAIPANRTVKRASLFFTADNSGEFYLNGHKVGGATDFHAAAEFEVTKHLQAGDNLLAASVHNDGSEPNPAGLIAWLRIEFTQGDPLLVGTDSGWKSGRKESAGWREAGFDETGWVAAKQLGPEGMAPWGEITGPEDRRLPARVLRREFVVEKKIKRATASISGLGSCEFYLNGSKVGDQVLSPGLTEYPKRAFYVTYDVTLQ